MGRDISNKERERAIYSFLSIKPEDVNLKKCNAAADSFWSCYLDEYKNSYFSSKSTIIVGVVLCLIALSAYAMFVFSSIAVPFIVAVVCALSLIVIPVINKISYPTYAKEINKVFLIILGVLALAFFALSIVFKEKLLGSFDALNIAIPDKGASDYKIDESQSVGSISVKIFYDGAYNNALGWLISLPVLFAATFGILVWKYKSSKVVGKKDANLQYFLFILIFIGGYALFASILRLSYPTSQDEILSRLSKYQSYANGGVQFGAFMAMAVYVVAMILLVMKKVETKKNNLAQGLHRQRRQIKGFFEDHWKPVVIIASVVIIVVSIVVPVTTSKKINEERGYRIGLVSGDVQGKNSSLTEIVIDDGSRATAESIKKKGFYGYTNLKKVDIVAPSLKTIEYEAFYNCTSLESITFPDSLTTIENEAFYNCTSLGSLTLPESLTTIGDSAFRECKSLKQISFPLNTTSFGNWCLQDCDSLQVLEMCPVKDGLRTIFGQNRVTNIYGFSTYYAKVPTTLKRIVVIKGTTVIPAQAFYGCNNGATIELPNGITEIGNEAFRLNTKTTSITIPDSISKMGTNVFYDCWALESMTIPSGITTLPSYTFYDCSSLTSVTFKYAITKIGESAFNGCKMLTDIYYPGTQAQWKAVSKGSGSFSSVPTDCIVHCTDGDMLRNAK